MLRPFRQLVAAIALVLPYLADSSSVILNQEHSGGVTVEKPADTTPEILIFQGDSIIETMSVDTGSELNVIVEFNEEPFLRAAAAAKKKFGSLAGSKGAAAMKASKRLIDEEHENFKSDLRQIDGNGPGKHESVIAREYRGTFNGAAVRIPAARINKLINLASVKRVCSDFRVRANLDESVPRIHADDVWGLGYTGTGAVVGIIDAGIDYNHPALGGGIGPLHKVIGGYDFVNGDADPMDDNGHGTIIAGIVAADGEVHGVAPGAKLVAYKVLDQWGIGIVSNVLAAIEKSCDPDGDPLTDDALDVINMSFSGPGNSSDPLCQAIANATASGVVCVVAAGYGEKYQSITSPACSPDAITVGSLDRWGGCDYYSAKGPTRDLFAIKPDLIAPGVGIRLTAPGASYSEESGTSCAAAHVAGCAALLRQVHPAWSAARIKQCLMLGTDLNNTDAFSEGSGRLNALDAVTLSTLIDPPSISLGLYADTQGVTVKSVDLKIVNTGTGTASYHLYTSLYRPHAGISLTCSPTDFAVQAGDSALVTFTITVDNAAVPYLPDPPYAYIGAVNVDINGKAIRVPFAFLKTGVIHMRMREFPSMSLIHDRTGKTWQVSSTMFDSITNVLVPRGVYDIMTYYGMGMDAFNVVKEGVPSGSTVEIGKSDAEYTATVAPVDANGASLTDFYATGRLIHRASGIGHSTGVRSLNRLSSMSSAYGWEWLVPQYTNGCFHQFAGLINGISHDTTFTNTPSDLKKYVFQFNVPPSVNGLRVPLIYWTAPWKAPMSGGIINPVTPPLTSPFTESAYFMPLPDDTFFIGYITRRAYEYGTTPEKLLFESACLAMNMDGSYSVYRKLGQRQPLYSSTSDTVEINLGPLFWTGRFRNRTDTMRIWSADQTVWYNQTFDVLPYNSTHRYTLYNNGLQVWTDTLRFNQGSPLCNPVKLTPGTYTLVTQCEDYFVGDVRGLTKATVTFNTQIADKDPPIIRDFHIEAQGKRTAHLFADRPATISIELWDSLSTATATAFYRYGDDTTWFPLPLTGAGMQYTGIPPLLANGTYVSLKIVANDASGNEMICEMSPAFRIYRPNNAPVLAAIGNKTVAENDVLQFTLAAADADGDALTYSATGLPIGATFDPVTATFTWQPSFDQARTYSGMIFTVSDGTLTDDETVTVTVDNTPRPPILAPIGDKTVREGYLLQFTIQATDPEIGVIGLIYSATGLPPGATFDPSTRMFSWVPDFTRAGTYPSVTFRAVGNGGIDEETITITVTESHMPVFNQHAYAIAVAENELVQFQLQATDLDGDVLTYSARWLPPGASFDPGTATFTWRPAFDQAGNYQSEFYVTDGLSPLSTDEATAYFIVYNTNRPPVLSVIGDKAVAENEVLQFTLQASDLDGDVLQFSAAGLPQGADLNPSTGTFTWQPSFAQAGSYPDITFSASDGNATAQETITISVNNVNRPPWLDIPGPFEISENELLQFTLVGSDPDNDMLTFTADSLPPGAAFDPATATFSWRPGFDQAGIYPGAKFTVTDGIDIDSKPVPPFTVINTNRPPIITSIGDKVIAEGELLQFTLAASDPDGDALIYLTDRLPEGASFDQGTGTFTWRPTFMQAGTYTEIFFYADDGMFHATEIINISVSNTLHPPVLSPVGDKTIAENGLLQFTLAATDPAGGMVFYYVENMPSGASFDWETGTFTWRPDFYQAGTYPDIKLVAVDGESSDEETITVTVTNSDRPPLLAPTGIKTVAENTLLHFTLAATDADGDALTYSATGLPIGASFDPVTATFTWQPTFAQAGTYTGITFTVSDGEMSDDETITVTVMNTGRPPVLSAVGNKTVAENEMLQFSLAATDADGDMLTYTAAGLPTGATFDAGTATFTWQPTFAQAGTYLGITFTVSDGEMTDDETIIVTVTNTDRPPELAAVGNKTITENTLLQFTLAATDADGDALTYSATGLPTGASFNASTATFSWTPTFAQAGSYPGITLTVSDGSLTDAETITITVTNINRPPVLPPIGNKSVIEMDPLYFNVTATDADGDILTYSAENLPPGATFTLINGQYRFYWRPDLNQAGIYTNITFTVSDGSETDEEAITITVINANNPPYFNAIYPLTTSEGVPLVITLQAFDADNDPLTFSAAGLPEGSAFDPATATFTWTPDFDQSGTYPGITFTVTDGKGYQTRYVTLTVDNTNRPPMITPVGNRTVAENTLLQFTLAATDADGDALTYTATGLPTGASFDPATATFSWQPTFAQAGNYPGITFTVSDGSLTDDETITVTVMNSDRAPDLSTIGNKTVAENAQLQFTLAATDVDGDVLTYAATGLPTGASFDTATATFSWQPTFAQAGTYTGITFTVSDGEMTDDETITVTVTNSDRVPVLATVGNQTVAENGLLQFTLAATDADGDALTYTATGLPAGATFDAGTAMFTWQPTFAQSGTHTDVTFTVSDGEMTDDETITVTVMNTDRPPVLSAVGNKTVAENVMLQFSLAATDADGDALTYTAMGLPAGATFEAGTATFTWQPTFAQAGTHTGITFTVSDGEMTDDEAITVTVTNTDRVPVLAAIGNKTVAENSLLQFTVAATDADGDALTYSATGLPIGATFNTTTRQFSWQPNYTQAGSYPNVGFIVSGGTLTDDETITITVTNTNRAPVAANDAVSTNEDVGVRISVRNNDSDPDGDPLTVASVVQPSNGTATINTDNTITLAPRANYYGTVPFNYTISDGQGGSATATVTVTVTSVNDAPTVSITSPANGAVFNRYSNVTINATAADVDGTITKVQFYRNGALMGQDTSSPYAYTWTRATAGTHTLYCKATDNSGAITQSVTRTITVR